jgi:oligoendopeptidase F
MSFEYSRLPRDFPRSFLPAGVDLTNQDRLKQLFSTLESRSLKSTADLERWFKDQSELLAALYEEQALRYIRMTCQTDDPQREKDYLSFVENVEPVVKIGAFSLDRKYLKSPGRKSLSPERYSVLDKRVENNVAIFREQNVELEKEETKLAQKYAKIAGAMTVNYRGQERTMQQMARFLEETDRKVREETWLLSENRRQKDRDALSELYDELIGIREKIAKNAGFENYRDYMFRKKERFDYTPEDCFQFHRAVEEYVVPLLRELDKDRRSKLAVDPLRPYDLAVDPQSRGPLHPFKTSVELVKGCITVFEKVNPKFAAHLRRMSDLNLLDLDSRTGKAPGGYQSELMEIRLPFIFMNSVGRDQDVRTLLHESGHAFHTFAIRNQDMPIQYRGENIPLEFAEVASQTMEIIGGEHLEGTFYNKEDTERSRWEHLTSLVRLLAWIATIDAFQHWVYTNPGHSKEEREKYWISLREKYGGIESWKGYEKFRESFWQRQLHLYEVPFYYIEYAIAWTGALGLWTRYRKDPKGAISAYEKALALGGSKSLPDLFKAADMPFDFGPKTIKPYVQEIRQALKVK